MSTLRVFSPSGQEAIEIVLGLGALSALLDFLHLPHDQSVPPAWPGALWAPGLDQGQVDLLPFSDSKFQAALEQATL